MKGGNQSDEHSKLVDDLLHDFGSLPEIRIRIRVVGFDKLKKVKYGQPGEPDLDGYIGPWGFYFVIECKTGEADLNPDQKKYQAALLKRGVIYVKARSREQAWKDFWQQYQDKLDRMKQDFLKS